MDKKLQSELERTATTNESIRTLTKELYEQKILRENFESRFKHYENQFTKDTKLNKESADSQQGNQFIT